MRSTTASGTVLTSIMLGVRRQKMQCGDEADSQMVTMFPCQRIIQLNPRKKENTECYCHEGKQMLLCLLRLLEKADFSLE